jgi:hypothetical protein
VVPREDEYDWETDHEQQRRGLLDGLGQVERVSQVGESLQQAPRARDIEQPPLDHFEAAQRVPPACGPALCGRVVHSANPHVGAVYRTAAAHRMGRAGSPTDASFGRDRER